MAGAVVFQQAAKFMRDRVGWLFAFHASPDDQKKAADLCRL